MIQAINTPQISMTALDQKKHKAAQEFVKSFYAQSINLMMQNSAEENYERDIYASFLSEAIGEKIAVNGSSSAMVTQIYQHMAGQKTMIAQPLPIQHTTEVSHDILSRL